MSSQTIGLNHDSLVKIEVKVIHVFYFQYRTNEATCLKSFEARNHPVGCDEEQYHTVNGSQHLFFLLRLFESGDLNK